LEITFKKSDILIVSGITTEINNIYTFSYTFDTNGMYRLKWITPSEYENGFEQIKVVDNYIESIKLILGLSQENFRIKDHVYTATDLLESATIRTYNTATDCDNDISPLAEYSMEATYDGGNRLISYKVIKV